MFSLVHLRIDPRSRSLGQSVRVYKILLDFAKFPITGEALFCQGFIANAGREHTAVQGWEHLCELRGCQVGQETCPEVKSHTEDNR